MYPWGELACVSRDKAELRRLIANRRLQCVAIAAIATRPLAWFDTALNYMSDLLATSSHALAPACRVRLKVLIAHQNPAAGRRGIAVAGLLARELADSSSFEPSPWHFHVVSGRYGRAALSQLRSREN